MKKIIFTVAVILGAASLALVSCKKDKNNDPGPSTPATSGTFTDSRDSKTYKWVTIGSQTWMAENLNYQGSLSAGSSACPSGSQDSCNKYGELYTWDAANIACPNGWHLPSDAEWRLLEHNLGMTDADTSKSGVGSLHKRGNAQAIAIKLEEGGETGFNILLESPYSATGFWTSTQVPSSSNYWSRLLYTSDSSVYRQQTGNGANICVRCLKD